MKAERHIEGYAVSPVVSLLMRGRERIDGGWRQGEHRRAGSVCAIEALCGENKTASPAAMRWLVSAIPNDRRVELMMGTSIIEYNDHPATTKADILSLYDRAIAMAIGEAKP